MYQTSLFWSISGCSRMTQAQKSQCSAKNSIEIQYKKLPASKFKASVHWLIHWLQLTIRNRYMINKSNSLPSWSRVLEIVIFGHVVKELPYFMTAEVNYCVHKDPPLFLTLIQKNKTHMHPQYLVKIHLDISLQLRSSLANTSLLVTKFYVFRLTFWCISNLLNACYTTCLSLPL